MEDLAVFTALNHSGSFGKNFVKFKKKKICYSPAKVNNKSCNLIGTESGQYSPHPARSQRAVSDLSRDEITSIASLQPFIY